MAEKSKAIKVLVIDPSFFTPHYDLAFLNGLTQTGCNARLITSKFLYDSNLNTKTKNIRNSFFKLTSFPILKQLCLKSARFRQILKTLEYPFDWFFVLFIILRFQPDIIHFQWVVTPGLDGVIISLLRKLKFKVVYTIHNVLPHNETPVSLRQYLKLYKIVNGVVIHSETSKQELFVKMPGLNTRKQVIPHGLLFGSSEKLPADQARNILNLPQDKLIFLFFGTILPYKGLAFLLTAFAKLVEQVPQAVLIVAGKDGEPMEPYYQLVEKLHLEKHVVFHTGFVTDNKIPVYYSAADIAVLPYLKISQSGVIMTALRFGVPVVASDLGGFRETVISGKNGFLVPPQDTEALANSLIALAADARLRADMSSYILKIDHERYSWRKIGETTTEFYKSLLDVPSA